MGVSEEGEGEGEEGAMEDEEVECLIAGLIYKVSTTIPRTRDSPLRCRQWKREQEGRGFSRHQPSITPQATDLPLLLLLLFSSIAEANQALQQGLIKGYISREYATVVLNRKGEAFPGTGV